jgi:hypothetical protein
VFFLTGAAGGASHPHLAIGQAFPEAVTIAAQNVYRGCNSIVVQAPFGTPWPDIVAHFSDPSTVQGVWRYANGEQHYRAVYFPNPAAPVDGPETTDVPVQGLFFCVTEDGAVS